MVTYSYNDVDHFDGGFFLQNLNLANHPKQIEIISKNGDVTTFKVCYESEITAQEKLDLDSAVAEYKGIDFLVKSRIEKVDKNTRILIKKGYTFDGVEFSLSNNAQKNIMNKRDDVEFDTENSIEFPILFPNKNDSASPLFSKQKVIDMHREATNIVEEHIGSGVGIKMQLKSKTTKADLDLVVDNRT